MLNEFINWLFINRVDNVLKTPIEIEEYWENVKINVKFE